MEVDGNKAYLKSWGEEEGKESAESDSAWKCHSKIQFCMCQLEYKIEYTAVKDIMVDLRQLATN